MSTARHFSKGRGAALVAVCWVLLVLSIMASATMQAVKYQYSVQSVDESRAEAKLAAEGAIYAAIHKAITSPGGGAAPKGGSYKVGELTVSVKVSAEAGRVNINRASQPFIAGIIAAQGVEERKALAIAAAIIDWRDSDNLKQFDGAEAAEYRRANLQQVPRNSPFETIGELQQVKGMSQPLYNRVAPMMTVYSLSGDVDLNQAPASLKDAFVWMNEQKWQDQDWQSPTKNNRSVLNPTGSQAAGRSYRFQAEVGTPKGIPFSLQATIRITGNRQRAFQVLDWEEVFSK